MSSGAARARTAARALQDRERALAERLRGELVALSDSHIFQWETHYRPLVREAVAESVSLIQDESIRSAALASLYREFREHSREIFEKGLAHTAENSGSGAYAAAKLRRGLQRFLQLPVAIYLDRLDRGATPPELERLVCSVLLKGILVGASRAEHGDVRGAQILVESEDEWADYLVFFTDQDFYTFLNELPFGPTRTDLAACVTPALRAIENLIEAGEAATLGMPARGLVSLHPRRLELTLSSRHTPGATPALLRIHCYLSPGFNDFRRLEESGYRNTALIIGSFPDDVEDRIQQHNSLRPITLNVNTSRFRDPQAAAERAEGVLRAEVARRGGVVAPQPLRFNWAKDFPLQSAVIAQQYRVRRPTVRALLSDVEARNGIHVWCSVRRSGKTTACFALDSTTGSSVVIPQTTAGTDTFADADFFFRAVDQVLREETPLPYGFVEETVRAMIPRTHASRSKVVLILDEYETLFHRLNAVALRKPELRYTIAQPLLNQLVSFSRNNLLIFVGQRPDAHAILLDQNQLSPFVQQDQFPLFAHTRGSLTSEFRELVHKVLTSPFVLDASFVDALYEETAGHPYLAVSLLVSFVDWLIEQGRTTADLHLSRDDFQLFARLRLSADEIVLNKELGWFISVVAEALGEGMRRHDPWLHSVYWSIKQVCSHSPRTLTCSRSEFAELLRSPAGRAHSVYDPDTILRTGSEANFLSIAGDRVSPGIRLIGRIAATVTPQVAY